METINILHLPNEILTLIDDELDIEEMINLGLTCKNLHYIAKVKLGTIRKQQFKRLTAIYNPNISKVKRLTATDNPKINNLEFMTNFSKQEFRKLTATDNPNIVNIDFMTNLSKHATL